jgi:hypothetical protein
VAFDRLEIAVVLSVLNLVTLFLFGKIKEQHPSESAEKDR